MPALDKVYYTQVGKFMDQCNIMSSVKDTYEEVKELEEQSNTIMRTTCIEIYAILNKMSKATQLKVEQNIAKGRKKVEGELEEAFASDDIVTEVLPSTFSSSSSQVEKIL